jgi:hypothetical protein
MCGELDEDIHIDNEVFDRLLQISRHHGVTPAEATGTIGDLEDPSGRASYMDALFSAGLTRAVTDTTIATEGQRIDAIAAQAIAFARLAGFLAGQLPPEADLYRACVEALTDGHAMPRRTAEKLRAAQDHHHHHHHDDHHHGPDKHHDQGH